MSDRALTDSDEASDADGDDDPFKGGGVPKVSSMRLEEAWITDTGRDYLRSESGT